MPKISILVAVYNTAAYLPQCLDSLLSQTLKDIEVLCVMMRQRISLWIFSISMLKRTNV